MMPVRSPPQKSHALAKAWPSSKHMNRPLGEYQEEHDRWRAEKVRQVAVKRPIDKQTIRLHGLAHHTYDREWQPHSAVGLD
jgi:hypothetical protein